MNVPTSLFSTASKFNQRDIDQIIVSNLIQSFRETSSFSPTVLLCLFVPKPGCPFQVKFLNDGAVNNSSLYEIEALTRAVKNNSATLEVLGGQHTAFALQKLLASADGADYRSKYTHLKTIIVALKHGLDMMDQAQLLSGIHTSVFTPAVRSILSHCFHHSLTSSFRLGHLQFTMLLIGSDAPSERNTCQTTYSDYIER